MGGIRRGSGTWRLIRNIPSGGFGGRSIRAPGRASRVRGEMGSPNSGRGSVGEDPFSRGCRGEEGKAWGAAEKGGLVEVGVRLTQEQEEQQGL